MHRRRMPRLKRSRIFRGFVPVPPLTGQPRQDRAPNLVSNILASRSLPRWHFIRQVVSSNYRRDWEYLQLFASLDDSADETVVDCLFGGQPIVPVNVLQ